LAGSKNSKIENIAEILAILNEKSLSKDWLLGELRRHNVRSSAFATKNNYEILKTIKPKVIEKIFDSLSEEDLIIKDVKTLTRTLHWRLNSPKSQSLLRLFSFKIAKISAIFSILEFFDPAKQF